MTGGTGGGPADGPPGELEVLVPPPHPARRTSAKRSQVALDNFFIPNFTVRPPIHPESVASCAALSSARTVLAIMSNRTGRIIETRTATWRIDHPTYFQSSHGVFSCADWRPFSSSRSPTPSPWHRAPSTPAVVVACGDPYFSVRSLPLARRVLVSCESSVRDRKTSMRHS
jgi:hypothetical protein